MSDFHRMELLHLDINQLIERCITFEHLNAEKIDEIERLRSELAALKEAQRWILVSERMPETQKSVLISCLYNGHRFCQKAVYIAPKSTLAEDFLSDECDCSDGSEEYDEENDCYWVKEGWWEDSLESDINWNISADVTHWRPLPQPPESEG